MAKTVNAKNEKQASENLIFGSRPKFANDCLKADGMDFNVDAIDFNASDIDFFTAFITRVLRFPTVVMSSPALEPQG